MKVRIILHDNTKYEADIADFDLADFITTTNTSPDQLIQFGERGLAKHMIKVVEPVLQEEIPTE